MNKRGHVPLRMCIGCRSRRKKEEMIRLVRTLEGLVPADGKAWSGRGFYLCPGSECLRKAQKKNLIGPVVRMEATRISAIDWAKVGGGLQ